MKWWTLLILAITVSTTSCTSVSDMTQSNNNAIEIYGWINEIDGKYYLSLRLTNRGQVPQTILTKNYSRFGSMTNGSRDPFIGLSYRLCHTEMADGTDKWSFVPSLPTLAPVTLFKDETATMLVGLDDTFVEIVNNPKKRLTLRYSIHEDIATRFGLWHGTIEMKETIETLRSR